MRARAVLLLSMSSLLVASVASVAVRALAQHAAAAQDVAASALPPGTLTKLASGDPEQVRAALDDVRIAGAAGAEAVPSIVLLLKKGLTLTLTEAALATLGDVQAPASTPEIAAYARHRTVRIRGAAMAALSKTGGPVAVAALRAGLSDPDASVRQIAANALGAMGAHDALPDLFLALDHRIPGVAASIGKMCTGTDCERFAQKISDLPFDVLASGLAPMLFRGAGEVSDDTKILVVTKLRDARTAQAATFLLSVQKGWPKDASLRVYQALGQAVTATAGMR